MEIFINRTEELEILENEYAKAIPSLVIVYGRLRTGKTSLVTQFCKNKNAVYYLVSEESEAQNMNNFGNLIADLYNDDFSQNTDIINWDSLFKLAVSHAEAKAQFAVQEKIVLVIDEFQYLVKSNRTFPTIFKKIWDTILQYENIMVILCGSMVSLMEDQVLSHSSPLYGKRTAQIKLTALLFRDFSDFFAEKDYKSLIELYAVTGGIPKYMLLFQEELELIPAIEKNILNRQAPLYEEPMFLIKKEVSEVGSYFSIMKTIASGHHKLSSISNCLGLPQTGLTKYLKTLIDLDILTREVPITEETPSKCKRGQYKIKDNFLLFWFKFVYPNLSRIESGHTEAIIDRLNDDIYEHHISYIYKDICIQRMWDFSASNTFGFELSRVGSWWDGNAEIDIVAMSVNKKTNIKTVMFGECKFSNEPMDIDVFYSLLDKSKKVTLKNRDRKELFVFFSISGYTDEFEQLAKERRGLWLLC